MKVKLSEIFPLNRLVALLAPVAATLAGLVAAWLADHAPLIAEQVSGSDLTAIFLAVAATVAGMAYKWLDGSQKYEARVDAALNENLTPLSIEGGTTTTVQDEDLAHAEADKPAAAKKRPAPRKKS
jgi:hypothetical protein